MGSEKEQLEQYIKGGCRGCPYCGHDGKSFIISGVSGGIDTVLQICTNLKCGREWKEIFVRRAVKLDDGMEVWEDEIDNG